MPLANKPRRGKCCSITAPTSIQPSRGRQPYTRYVAMHPIRRGVMPTDRVHCLPQQAQPRTIRPHRPQPSVSDAATQLRHAHPGSEREALHPLRRKTPVTSRYTRSVAIHPIRRGVMPTDRVHRLPQQAQPRNVPSRKKPRRLPLGNRRGPALTIQLSRSW